MLRSQRAAIFHQSAWATVCWSHSKRCSRLLSATVGCQPQRKFLRELCLSTIGFKTFQSLIWRFFTVIFNRMLRSNLDKVHIKLAMQMLDFS